VCQKTVSNDLVKNTVRPKKITKPKRKRIRYEINSGTKTEDAAKNIVETFGVEFAFVAGRGDIELSLRIEAEINPGSGSRSDLVKPNNNVIKSDKTQQANKRSYTLNRLSCDLLKNKVITKKMSKPKRKHYIVMFEPRYIITRFWS